MHRLFPASQNTRVWVIASAHKLERHWSALVSRQEAGDDGLTLASSERSIACEQQAFTGRLANRKPF